MEIEPISSSGSTADRWRRLWEERLQARPQARPEPSAISDPEPSATEAPVSSAATPVVDALDVEVTEHAGTGAEVVRLVQSDSGQVVSEVPHTRVLDLVARLLEENRRDDVGGSDGRQH